MFKLFKKNANNKVVAAEIKNPFKGKTTNEIIEEIHETYRNTRSCCFKTCNL